MAPAYTPQKMRMASALKTARNRANMSQERAAREVGTSRRHWIRWESGETMPNPAYLKGIAAKLDAPELLEFTEDEEESSQPMAREQDFLEALRPLAQLLAGDRSGLSNQVKA